MHWEGAETGTLTQSGGVPACKQSGLGSQKGQASLMEIVTGGTIASLLCFSSLGLVPVLDARLLNPYLLESTGEASMAEASMRNIDLYMVAAVWLSSVGIVTAPVRWHGIPAEAS